MSPRNETEQVKLDTDREDRVGIAEAIYCAGKTRAQVQIVAELAIQENRSTLFTRLSQEVWEELSPQVRRWADYDPTSLTAIGGTMPAAPPKADVAVVSAGMSDLPIVAEISRVLLFHGIRATEFHDMGAAGLWRLLERIGEVRDHRVVIAVAGMEGALFTVLGGLVHQPIIAVPTSVGYGVTSKGATALNAALGTCAPGVVVVNIDNGYGAATSALRILRSQREQPEPPEEMLPADQEDLADSG